MGRPQAVALIGVPTQAGTHESGALMGPDALRTAGLREALRELGHRVEDWGNLSPDPMAIPSHPNLVIHGLAETAGWVSATARTGERALEAGLVPVFLGGDHSMSAGTVSGITAGGRKTGRPQFLLWLDAHSDLHTLDSTTSGNLHGTPVAYVTGREGFEGFFPPLVSPLDPACVTMMGTRSVDPAEREWLRGSSIVVHDMRQIDQLGVTTLIGRFLEKVAKVGGLLHVSLDVDLLDPTIAPAVGTTVPGGATFREAHLMMELIHDSGLLTSLDVAELNPFLDIRGQTARLMVDLVASLFGRSVLDRPTNAY